MASCANTLAIAFGTGGIFHAIDLEGSCMGRALGRKASGHLYNDRECVHIDMEYRDLELQHVEIKREHVGIETEARSSSV